MLKLNADTTNNPDNTGGCWATPHQELLLKAGLLDQEAALAAWNQWCSEVDIEEDHLDLGSFRLLPLVYHNLKQHESKIPLMGRLRGIHHQAWVQNQFQVSACSKIITDFHSAGIRTLVLKGASLSENYYPTQGVRPMGDFDLLVPTQQAEQAIALLDQKGWQPIDRPIERLDRTYFTIRHAQGFANAEGRQLDLHWHVLINGMDENIDRHFWSGSIPLTLHNVETRCLNATDLFLHVCVHGAAWAPVPPVRWVADAMMILRKTGDQIDWDRLLFVAEQCQSSLALKAALTYLRKTFAIPIPFNLLERLASNPVSAQERHLFFIQTHRSVLLGVLPSLWAQYQLYQTRHDAKSRLHTLLGFPRYVAIYQALGSAASVLNWAVGKGAKRISKYVRHVKT